jgi:cytosine/adenosine deaminase-related metal-dependent hydrolase
VKQQVGIVIKGGLVLTVDAQRSILPDGAVAIDGGRIVRVGSTTEVGAAYEGRKTIDATGKLVMPGLVNAHTHVIGTLLRGGLSQDRELYDWLFNVLYPGLAAYSPDDARIGALLYCAEAVRGGITTIVDNADQGRADDIAVATIETYREVGVRAIYARMIFDAAAEHTSKLVELIMRKGVKVRHATDLIESTDDAFAQIESLIDRFHGAEDGRLAIWPAPSVPNAKSEEGLARANELAARYGTMTTIHLAEAPFDATIHGVTSTAYLHALGFLSPRLLAAHCVYVTERDVRLLQTNGVAVAHNAISNLYLASGIAPIARMVAHGMTVAVTTDDANCNDSVNLFQAMKFAALVQRARDLDPTALTSEKVVEMVTIDAARAIGLDGEIGSLEAGKRADVIVLDLAQPQLVPLHHVPSALVYQAYGTEVETVIIDGTPVMENRELQFLDEARQAELYDDAQAASAAIAKRAGLAGADGGWRRAPR